MMLSLQDMVDKIEATPLHSMGLTGKGITVAVLDSGIRSDHPFIEGSVIKKYSVVEGDLEDSYGHGTHITGILLAVAPNVNIINIKILDDNGNTALSNIAKGIEIAIDMGAQIINISAGAPTSQCSDNHPLARLINKVSQEGFHIIGAGGNEGPSIKPNLPASAPGSIAVGAMGNKGTTAKYSSRGVACNETFPDCVAYGTDIISSYPPNIWKDMKGTSLAAPQVSGMLALMIEGLRTNFTREEIEIILSQSCTRIESFEKNNSSGWGLINCAKAYRSAQVNLGLL